MDNCCYNETTIILPNIEIYNKFKNTLHLYDFSDKEIIENENKLKIIILFNTKLYPPLKFYEEIIMNKYIKLYSEYHQYDMGFFGYIKCENERNIIQNYQFPKNKEELKKIEKYLVNNNKSLYNFMKDVFEDLIDLWND